MNNDGLDEYAEQALAIILRQLRSAASATEEISEKVMQDKVEAVLTDLVRKQEASE